MSIDINWSTLTTGPDGVALAEKIRDFVHDKFQTAVLPPFIKSVKVETFEFGTIAPEIEIKDICDPLPDFYEEIESDESDSGKENNSEDKVYYGTFQDRYGENQKKNSGSTVKGSQYSSSAQPADLRLIRSPMEVGNSHGTSTPGIPGGTSNLNYFHSHLATNLSGSRTPLAAVAGAHLYNGWPDCSYLFHRKRDLHAISECSTSPPTSAGPGPQEKTSVLTLVTSSNDTRPSTRDGTTVEESPKKERFPSLSPSPMPRLRKTRVEDIQTVFRVKYSGDVKLSLTAEILLDYPMPCFIGIPIQLRITGFIFDGVAVLASIRKRVHFCFLSPEDSLYSTINDSSENIKSIDPKVTSLLQEIKVDSEIGKREGGKQLLKNVGKVEKFVLEQVRRIFEDELVYPSFWTFLI